MARTLAIIDAAPFLRQTIAAVAERSGWRIDFAAADLEQGVERVRRRRPDLVTLDWGLSADAAAAVATLAPTPVVAVGRFDRRGDAERALAAGAAQVLAKPFGPRHLAAVLEAAAAAASLD